MCWRLELGRGRNCVSKTSGIVVGENDTAFGTDGTTLVAFDVNSGAMKWHPRQTPQNHQSALMAATGGGGAVAKDITFDSGNNNLGEQVVRFDATGAAAADAWAGTGLGYYAGDTWTGVPHGGTVAYSGKPFDNANTLWPDSEPFRCSCLFDIQVFNFSQTGPNQATIENELKAIQGLLDADPPLYPTCSAWLQGTMTGAQYIQFLFSAMGMAQIGLGMATFAGNYRMHLRERTNIRVRVFYLP